MQTYCPNFHGYILLGAAAKLGSILMICRIFGFNEIVTFVVMQADECVGVYLGYVSADGCMHVCIVQHIHFTECQKKNPFHDTYIYL